MKHFTKSITSNLARANIIWMISQYIDIIPTIALDFYRRIVKEIHTESDEIKSQSIGFSLKLFQSLNKLYDTQTKERAIILINYHLEKLFYDKNYYIREKSRFVKISIMHSNSQNDEIMMKMIEEIEKTNITCKENLNEMSVNKIENINSNTMSFNHYVKL